MLELIAFGYVIRVDPKVEALVIRLDHQDVSAVHLDATKMYHDVRPHDFFVVHDNNGIVLITVTERNFTEDKFVACVVEALRSHIVSIETVFLKKDQKHANPCPSV